MREIECCILFYFPHVYKRGHTLGILEGIYEGNRRGYNRAHTLGYNE